MISFLSYLLSRGFRQPAISTSSDATGKGKHQSPVPPSVIEQTRRQRDCGLTEASTQRDAMIRAWSLESGLPTAEFVVAMHDLASNLPHYVGGGRSENLP